jgi:predicted adenine nucleotide alpha hydrolase (AANH) superfamily ATPase
VLHSLLLRDHRSAPQGRVLPHALFYNPNIHPRQEYDLRKASVMAYAAKLGRGVVEADYDHEAWEERVKGLEDEPERGQRCTKCFDMRLERTALYAYENRFSQFATTNGFARWKDINQVNRSGILAASRYPGMTFWSRNWRLGNAQILANSISKQEKFYRQNYCGCRFSLKNRVR